MKHSFSFWHGVKHTESPAVKPIGNTQTPALKRDSVNEWGYLFLLGAIAAGATLDVKLQDSIDGLAGWQDVPNGAATQITSLDADKTLLARIDGRFGREGRPYVRLDLTIAGGTVATGIASVDVALKEYPAVLENPLILDLSTQSPLIISTTP